MRIFLPIWVHDKEKKLPFHSLEMVIVTEISLWLILILTITLRDRDLRYSYSTV